MDDQIVLMHKTKPMVNVGEGIITGLVPALQIDSPDPTIQWSGAHFPRKLYLQTVAFAKWCAEEYGGEVQGRLYYSEARKKWRVVILPQWISRNLHTEEIEGHLLRSKALRIVEGGDWVQNGTWHSHAFAGAGQSTVDLADELKQPGFHYTVGSLRSVKSSFDCRYSFRGLMYELEYKDILPKPCVDPSRCNAFPEVWKEMLIKDTRTKTTSLVTYSGFGCSRGYGGGSPSHITYRARKYSKLEWEEFIQSGEYAKEIRETNERINDGEWFTAGETKGDDGNRVSDEFTKAEDINYLADEYRADNGMIRVLGQILEEITGYEDIELALRDMVASFDSRMSDDLEEYINMRD